jgi:hypothetical protein
VIKWGLQGPQTLRKKLYAEHLDTLGVCNIGFGGFEVLDHIDSAVTKVDTEALISAL